jgi:4-hydroxymandelate oxidase
LEPAGRIAPRPELVNVLEFEVMAQRRLGSTVYSAVADGDRRVFDRMIFRPRMLVDTMKLDLSVELFGQKLFAPILVGPASEQQRFHPEAELATARGADAGKAPVVISDRSSVPIEKIAAASKGTLWYQVYPQAEMTPVLARVQQAVKAGCKVVCLTVGTPSLGDPHMTWAVVDQVKQAAKVPVVLKGVMSADDAQAAVDKGAAGIVVSNHGEIVPGLAPPIAVLPSVVDAVGGRIPVLVDGGFRRGSDILKALALGARAVLVVRPAMWGLAAYGSDGVQGVVEMLQSELAGMMAGCGKPNLASLDRSLVRILKR